MTHSNSSEGVVNQPRLGSSSAEPSSGPGGSEAALARGSDAQQRPQPAVNSLASMPVTLHVRIPLAGFRLQTLARLAPGSIVATIWPGSEDLPVSAGGVRIAWAEFAITDPKRSVRVTRIS